MITCSQNCDGDETADEVTDANCNSKYYSGPNRGKRHVSKVMRKKSKSANAARWSKKSQPLASAGSRIINLGELSKLIEQLTTHSAECGGSCVLDGETSHIGLAVVLQARCSKCQQIFRIHSSTYTSTSTRNKQWHVNLGAVLGQMATGGGNTRLNQVLTTMGVPGMRKQMFRKIEQFLGEAMKEQLLVAMAKAGEEEKEIAIENNHFHQGIPYISIVADGGWSKRSHKHSYNAKSGVGVIFGLKTKKLLFLGIRNKYCSICAVAHHKEQSSPKHICYRNWSGTSCGMESDIVAEGFRLSERTHGIRYLKMVGDGDSSVMTKVRETVPYGTSVEKIECANHAVKCYRSRLELLVKDHPEFKGKGGLTKRAILRLTVGARVAIKLHSIDGNVQQLRHDLRNGPAHVFGDHSACNPSFCKYRQIENADEEENAVESDESSDDLEEVDHDSEGHDTLIEQLSDLVAGETEYEAEVTPEDELAARSGFRRSLEHLPDGLYRKVLACGDRLVVLAPQLISNTTSNLAECYMGLRSICDGGKQFNLVIKN